MEFELTTLAVSGTDCTGSCKSNYHMIMTMTGQRVVAHHFWVICPSSIDFNLSAMILSKNQSIYLVEETWVTKENNRPATSNWTTSSHNNRPATSNWTTSSHNNRPAASNWTTSSHNNRPAASNWTTSSHHILLSTFGHWWELNS